jgi:hypothetical protein
MCEWRGPGRDVTAPPPVMHVYYHREGEEPMPIYRVTLKEPATPHEPFLIRAPVAQVAQRAALCLLQASLPHAARGTAPNLDPDLTTCVQVHDSGYPDTGPLEILAPVHH